MPQLFISYRRYDSADITGRLNDHLKAHFGEESVFMDIDSIPYGTDFRTHIVEAVIQCDLLLAIIGENWLTVTFDKGPKQGQRRLDQPDDYVRIEIETALARGIPIVPVIVGHAQMPGTEDFPESLRDLSHRNAAIVRPEQDFQLHTDRLIRGLEKLLEQNSRLKSGLQKTSHLVDNDPEMALVRARGLVDSVIREIYDRRLNEPAGTRRLESLVDRLTKTGYLPERFRQTLTARPSLTGLMEIIKWYMEVEQPDAMGQLTSRQICNVVAEEPHADVPIIPRGLRSFDAEDANFFLDLLPGPRKDGLPESIGFWKRHIESADETSFTVGVLYGPSGCGKSSFVKAGLLPRLSANVLPVYVEATADETEIRLLRGLRTQCPDLPVELDLPGVIKALQQGTGLPPDHKVLIVLDQLEQWLHANRGDETRQLVMALRQCDGVHVQCLILIRDDFWLALNRLTRELHIELIEGDNLALVDLFDRNHARSVLWKFGKAYQALTDELSTEQAAFLDQAVEGMSKDGWVICVRLALFAQMMKGKSWTPSALKAVGGTEGIGVTFLEDTFASPKANPRYRIHLKGAQSVLKTLLPEAQTNIKGHMRSQEELLQASGYPRGSADFHELIRILVRELRLITPTDPEGDLRLAGGHDSSVVDGHSFVLQNHDDDLTRQADRNEAVPSSVRSDLQRQTSVTRYYQFTHDYLVPSLRDWLTRKQKETAPGRAVLLLEDCTEVWSSQPEIRHLPTLAQWIRIVSLTSRTFWTQQQKTMMRAAGNYHAVCCASVLALLVAATGIGLFLRSRVIDQQKQTYAEGLVQAVLEAKVTQVGPIIQKMAGYQKWTVPRLQNERQKVGINSSEKLNASLALLKDDPGQVAFLFDRLLDAKPDEVSVIRDALAPYQQPLIEKLWSVVESPEKGNSSHRLQAASALSRYDPDSPRWETTQAAIVNDLITVPAGDLSFWLDSLHDVAGKLIPQLSFVYRDRSVDRGETQRSLATDILAVFASDQMPVLANLLMDSDPRQFAVIFPRFVALGEEGPSLLKKELNQSLPADLPSSDELRERLAKRQANAAVALLRMKQSTLVWPLLNHGPDPRLRSYLINRFAALGVDPAILIEQLDEQTEISIRRALIQSLGDFNETKLTAETRQRLIPKLRSLYETEVDAGLHASVEWLLRRWGQGDWIKDVNRQWATGQTAHGAWTGQNVADATASSSSVPSSRWYVNSQGQTLIVIPGPVEFMMGSPETDEAFEGAEPLHRRRIGRTFALSATPVTLEQYQTHATEQKFDVDRRLPKRFPRVSEFPMVNLTWYEVAIYCNWLSNKEGYSEVYDIMGNSIRLKPNYLSLNGYRLPTGPEYEYATRAGSTTARYYGESDDLLPKYAWYIKNSEERIWPVANLKPNDFGLFDMHGNVFHWCQTGYKAIPFGAPVVDDTEEDLVVAEASLVIRGGASVSTSAELRSAARTRFFLPNLNADDTGFCIARTIKPVDAKQPLRE
jgi:formylglycine-generating enzyme required for sulfatase activity